MPIAYRLSPTFVQERTWAVHSGQTVKSESPVAREYAAEIPRYFVSGIVFISVVHVKLLLKILESKVHGN